MKAMILAAGRGKRMRPLTNTIPKALLKVNNKPLIEYHLEKLSAAGFKDVVINAAHLAQQIQDTLGDGARFGVNIQYSVEPENGLETGGGIFNALPQLGPEAFLVISSDVWTDYNFADIPQNISGLAHLVLVNNPEHHPEGDFHLQDKNVLPLGKDKLNFSGIGVYHPDLFKECTAGFFPILPLLDKAIAKHKVTGEHFQGRWVNLGTPEQLEKLNAMFKLQTER